MERKARSSTPFGKGNGRGSPMYLLRNSWQSPCDAFELPAWSHPQLCLQLYFTAKLPDLFLTGHAGGSSSSLAQLFPTWGFRWQFPGTGRQSRLGSIWAHLCGGACPCVREIIPQTYFMHVSGLSEQLCRDVPVHPTVCRAAEHSQNCCCPGSLWWALVQEMSCH